ncbi:MULTISPECIES: glutamyl-tRNA reductase [Halostella]|uniref:glutamyl-tRNA reductase n=1 Tax=Halostella TaxID=1843185 RepID=UPI0019626E3B|nr:MULTISPECIES: glutamyl-tRNA reductase [Halostella]
MMGSTGVISGVSVSFESATVDVLADASGPDQRTVVSGLLAREGIEEAFALQTCNRVEAYVVSDDPAAGRAALDEFVAGVPDDAAAEMDHEESLRHLLRVAAGLESLVLGEDQILGQVRTAYEDARGVGGIGPMLEDAVTKAIHVGERVRTETSINEGAVSLGTAAARLADRETDLADATVLVVGAGEMGTLAARSLAAHGADRLIVANRTVPHAEHVAKEVDTEARAVALPAVPSAAERADVVVTATGSEEYLLDAADLDGAGATVVVDLAQPRDVAPAAEDLPTAAVYDLDALESVTDETRERRQAAAERVEGMIDEEFDLLLDQYKRKRADEVIAAMYESAEGIKSRELSTAMSKLEAEGEITDEQREVVESLADALVSQLLAAPTKSLRDAAAEDDWTTIQTALRLFDPQFGGEGGPPDFVTEAAPGDLPGELADDVPTDAPIGSFDDD